MFESVIETKRQSRRSVRTLILLVAVSIHVIALGVAVAENYLDVPPIEEPPMLGDIRIEPAPPPPPPPNKPEAKLDPIPDAPKPIAEPHPEIAPEDYDYDAIVEPEAIPDDTYLKNLPVPPKETGMPGGANGGTQGGTGFVPSKVPDEPMRHPDVEAERTKYVSPEYPRRARIAGTEGTVILDVTIKKDGTVGKIDVIQGLGMGCTDAAIDAVKRWRYTPAEYNGAIVEQLLKLTVEFKFE